MKVIPYIIDEVPIKMKSFDMHMIRLRVLLEGGKHIWKMDTGSLSDVESELNDNDIYGAVASADGVAWIEVDQQKTPLSDFCT